MTKASLSLAAVLLLSACGDSTTPEPAAPKAATTPSPAPAPSTAMPTARLEPVDGLPEGISIPRVAGLDAAVLARINAVLDREREDAVHAREACRRTADGRPINYALDARETYNDNGLLSVRMVGEAFCGGANGTTLGSAHSFDLTSGAEIDVIAATGLDRATLFELARGRYAGEAACADVLADRSRPGNQEPADVSAAYLDRAGIGTVLTFNSGASESCGAEPAVIPLVEIQRQGRLAPPLDRLN